MANNNLLIIQVSINLTNLDQPNISTHHYQHNKLNWFQDHKNIIIDQHFRIINFVSKHR